MKNTISSGRKLALAALALSASLSVSLIATGCAGILSKDIKSVGVVKSERLYLRLAPLDSVVVAELNRAGVDPVEFAEELEAEIRYRLYLRGQEEAPDSVTAAVVVTFAVRHLQPGSANTGTYAAYSLTGTRRTGGRPEFVEWTTQGRSRDNVPGAFTTRHLARQAADEVMARLQRPKSDEPPPPLHLMR